MAYIEKKIALDYLGSLNLFNIVALSFLSSYEDFVLRVKYMTDEEEIHNEIHSLKGITLNLGMVLLYDETTKLLKKIRDKENYSLTSLFEIFKNTYEELKVIIS